MQWNEPSTHLKTISLQDHASQTPIFPVSHWDKLLEHATLTLKSLRTSRINSLLSAHADSHGGFDFNKKPLAPPSTHMRVYKDLET